MSTNCRAGLDGVATYPPVRLSDTVQWHWEVRPFAVMRQAHDSFLLERELEGIKDMPMTQGLRRQ